MIKDHFDHWLSNDPNRAKDLLDRVIEKAEERLRKKQDKAGKAIYKQKHDAASAPAGK